MDFRLLVILFMGAAIAALLKGRTRNAARRLTALRRFGSVEIGGVSRKEHDWCKEEPLLRNLGDRLGRAGFLLPAERRKAATVRAVFIVIGAAAGAGCVWHSDWRLLLGVLAGCYAGFVGWAYFLRFRAGWFEREILFRVPIALESLILLVESGVGLLPAIERLVGTGNGSRSTDPVHYLLRLVYELSARGVPFGGALQLVADSCDQRIIRHVFLHLDISGNEGGELIPSLRSLSSHAHIEWKLSVEQRVKRLENLVVFPVFVSVIGLVLLTAAVPLVPLVNLRETLKSRTSVAAPGDSGGEVFRDHP